MNSIIIIKNIYIIIMEKIYTAISEGLLKNASKLFMKIIKSYVL